MRCISMLAVGGILLAGPATNLCAQDDDHSFVTAYTGSELIGHEVRQFDEQELVIGPARSGVAKTQKLEGRITRFDYQDPGDRSSLERIRNYEQALLAGGFELVYRCSRSECGEEIQIAGIGYYPPDRYVAARLARAAGDVWVAVYVAAGPNTKIQVVEVKPMETGMVEVNAGALGESLSATGHVAVYGIYFDTGKADLKTESAEALTQIAGLLEHNPSLTLHVVGHTDNAGGFDANLDLSSKRAAAVVTALTTQYAVAPARLKASGVGPLAPVASNATDAGRTRNRRVELVAQ
jgi:OOP family OmpA-OmpF porin